MAFKCLLFFPIIHNNGTLIALEADLPFLVSNPGVHIALGTCRVACFLVWEMTRFRKCSDDPPVTPTITAASVADVRR